MANVIADFEQRRTTQKLPEFRPGDTVVVDVTDGRFTFAKKGA